MTALSQSTREALRDMLSRGVCRKEIARDLGVSLRSVFKHAGGTVRPRFYPPSKQCVVCGVEYFPTAKTQAPGHWRHRTACSVKCGASLSWSKVNATRTQA